MTRFKHREARGDEQQRSFLICHRGFARELHRIMRARAFLNYFFAGLKNIQCVAEKSCEIKRTQFMALAKTVREEKANGLVCCGVGVLHCSNDGWKFEGEEE